ncbi:MAG: L-aspartate oxidase [Bdellovibrionaceae bacterium]|nr:L-aspartate oxidase [Pseudobdellovibrionaceae bacterium]
MNTNKSDYLIIGSGLAGLASALKLAQLGKVHLITKDILSSANSTWAQGGIAAVISKEDSFESHIQDTLVAGAGLCNHNTVENYVAQAPERIKDLINWGVNFDKRKNHQTSDSFEMDLTKEGGHSYRRILHFEDQTGLHIHSQVLKKVLENKNITIWENTFAIDLILNKQIDASDMSSTRCVGCYALVKKTNLVEGFLAKEVILATGGAGKVYLYTTNWSGATGDGIAMAYRAGARVANLEFMQFHPTCLYHPDSRNFLISEALRGEGGELKNSSGVAFMKKYHPLGSLAPRDIVARSIDAEMKKSGDPCVYLDMTHQNPDFLKSRFPAIYKKCLEYQIDLTKQPIPVVPAAHYLCGGVLTDLNGQTDIKNLWCLGESACTGLHGANRLASNSLLECLTMAHNCYEKIKDSKSTLFQQEPRPWSYPEKPDDDEMIVIHHMWSEIRQLMWNYMGIVRSNKRLLRAQARLKNILQEVKEYYSEYRIHSDIIELRNIAIVADLSVECALKRTESRGIHFNIDYPFYSPENDLKTKPQNTVLLRGLR